MAIDYQLGIIYRLLSLLNNSQQSIFKLVKTRIKSIRAKSHMVLFSNTSRGEWQDLENA